MDAATAPAPERQATVPPLIHRYVVPGREPQPGDIALCGYRKRKPGGMKPMGSANCVVCAEVSREMGLT